MILNQNSVPPMPDPYSPATADSAFAAWCAAVALLSGRTQLGAALGQIALKGKLQELRNGSTALTVVAQAPIFDAATLNTTAQPWLDPVPVQDSGLVSAYPEQPAGPVPVQTQTTCRCIARRRYPESGASGPCDAILVMWVEGEAWWWRHLDPALDEDHELVPQEQQQASA